MTLIPTIIPSLSMPISQSQLHNLLRTESSDWPECVCLCDLDHHQFPVLFITSMSWFSSFQFFFFSLSSSSSPFSQANKCIIQKPLNGLIIRSYLSSLLTLPSVLYPLSLPSLLFGYCIYSY